MIIFSADHDTRDFPFGVEGLLGPDRLDEPLDVGCKETFFQLEEFGESNNERNCPSAFERAELQDCLNLYKNVISVIDTNNLNIPRTIGHYARKRH